MFELKVDRGKNRIHLRMVGFFTLDEVRKCSDGLLAEALGLEPGFDLLCDISEFKPTTEDVIAEIAKAQAAIGQLGMRRVVRVVRSEGALAATQWARAKRDAHVTYETVIVKTLPEAFTVLG